MPTGVSRPLLTHAARSAVKRALQSTLVTLAVAAGSSAAAPVAAQEDPNFQGTSFLRIDPDRIVIQDANGFAPCGECHTAEWEVWRETPHSTGFDELHRTESAQDILDQMGLRVTKRQESLCMRCHYTVGRNRQAVAGVSCESCHGPAADWVDVHNRWGEGVTHPDQESPANREQRIATSIAGGMLQPSGDVYAVAANCYECHTVPNEELVNQGGHSTGSSDFELVERTNEIRHNFVHQQWGDETGNREQPPERRRALFVVGRLLDYEFAVRGLAEASAEGRYSRAMGRRIQNAYRALEEVAGVVEIPEVLEVLTLGTELRLTHNNQGQLAAAADRIRALGQAFTSSADGATLASLDPVIAGERPNVVAQAVSGGVGGEPQATAADPPGSANGGVEAPSTGPGLETPSTLQPGGEETTPASRPAPDLPGQIRSRPAWHEVDTQYSVVGAGECGSCHAGAEDWWYGDPHQMSGRRLLGEDPTARRIADAYGIGAAGMARGDQICMSCHGTVDPSTQMLSEQGVSCESCHGAGSGYLEPHEEGGNPQLGMRALKQASDRAQNCARCHHITDDRLLAAGHPSGAGYDIATANGQIEHWPGRRPERGRGQRGEPPYDALTAAALEGAFASQTAARPVPVVEVVEVATPPRPTNPPDPPTADGPNPGAVPATNAGTQPRAVGLAPQVTGPSPSADPARRDDDVSIPPITPTRFQEPGATVAGPVGLTPLPDDTSDLTTEELLLLVKQRLERLYTSLGRGN